MTIKEQYNSLDTSKLPKEVLFEVNEIKEDSKNFTNLPDFIKEDWEMLWNDVILKKYKSAIKSKSTSKKKATIEEVLLDSPEVRNKMPLHQQSVLKASHIPTVKRLEKELKEIPNIKSQDGKSKKETTVYAHYFSGGSDWFVTEKNDKQFYGYVILNGDFQMSEMGYFGIEEMRNNKTVELDFHWKKKSLAQALYEVDKDFFPNPKEKKKPSKTTAKTALKKKLAVTIDKEEVAHLSDEYKLIRRFRNTIQKEISFRKAQLLYWAFEKAIVARKVRKTSENADLFKKVNKKVVDLFKRMEGDDIKVIKKLEIKDQKLLQTIDEYLGSQKVDTAVRLVNRFIGMQGKDITETQATRLLKAIEKAKIDKSNRLYKEVQKAKKELNTFLETGKEPIEPSPQTLSGVKKKFL